MVVVHLMAVDHPLDPGAVVVRRVYIPFDPRYATMRSNELVGMPASMTGRGPGEGHVKPPASDASVDHDSPPFVLYRYLIFQIVLSPAVFPLCQTA